MKLHHITAIAALFTINSAAHACKQTPLSASTSALKAIIESIATTSEQEQSIVAIERQQDYGWEYNIKLSDGKSCQVVHYAAEIQPNCAIEVRRLESQACKEV